MKNTENGFRTDQLKSIGIGTTIEFVEACESPEKRRELSALLGVSEERIDGWLSLIYPNHQSALAAKVAGLLERGGVAVLKPGSQRRTLTSRGARD